MQTFGGPRALSGHDDAGQTLTWLSGRPARSYCIAPWQSASQTAHEVYLLFRAGEAVIVRTHKAWLSVQRVHAKHGQLELGLQDPRGELLSYPTPNLRVQRIAHTEGLAASPYPSHRRHRTRL